MNTISYSWYKIAKQTDHSYSWVYTDLPKEVQDLVIDFGKEIEAEDLYVKEANDGLEDEPHITIKYALLSDELKDIKDRLSDEKGGKIYLGESSIFEGEKYDVVKIEVESDDLKRLHDRLNELPHEDKHPDYESHATIAYVKKGKGKKYVGKFKINKSFKFNEVFFGDRDGKNSKIKLKASNIYNAHYNAHYEPKEALIGNILPIMRWYKSSRPTIESIAVRVRRANVKSYDDESLKSLCLPVSRALAKELVRNGYNATVARGLFRIDNPDPEAYAEWDANDFNSEDEMEDAKYTPLHYWVEVDGNTIVDITASQFNDELEGEEIPPIVMGSYSEWPRYTVQSHDWLGLED